MNLSTEILNSIEKKQDKEHLIDLSTKLIKKLQRNPDFLSSAITRARDKIKKEKFQFSHKEVNKSLSP